MVSINRSFFYGIGFASITWMISLYLYLNLKEYEMPSAALAQVSNEMGSKFAISGDQYTNSEQLIKYLQPVVQAPLLDLGELGLVKNEEDQRIRDEGYKIHAYNVLISNQLSVNRSIPDTRNALCKSVSYSQHLPSASVVICFYNEHFQTLLRTIHSIINRTPKALLKEIILIDDFGNLPSVNRDIQNYIKQHFPNLVKLYKTEKREGLIRARVFGARKSQGEVIVFLDSHVEVNLKWIEPLLARIKDDHKNVAMPVIDIINADTFAYSSSPLVRGGFNWGLHFKWENLPKGTLSKKEDFTKPINSPTMAGGLFAISKEYFEHLGEYDEGMNIWGGENLEISFRIWMCGGHLEMIPCSRVGHVFRQRRPYGAPNGEDTMLHNSLRVAHVWMDDYKKYFLEMRPDSKSIDFGDISARIELRKQLKCNDFDWYLKHVYPELALPSDNQERLKKKWAALETDKFQPWNMRKRNYVDAFQIRLANTSFCIQSAKDAKTKGSVLVLSKCLRLKKQTWYETDKGELVLSQLLCLQANKPSPILYKCHEMGGDQQWKHKGEPMSPIYNIAAGICLGAKRKQLNAQVTMKLCSDEDLVMWDIVR